MKKVILIGDSIRMGYEKYVRQELAAVAEVWGPKENGGTSANVLAHLEEWAVARQPAVVHVNCGLHDLVKKFGEAAVRVPLAEYEANVEKILATLKAKTAAVVIWAAITPVNERWHHEVKKFDRFETDVAAYNATARRVAEKLTVPINDLNAVVEQAGRDTILQPDGVHFTPAGYSLLGTAVAQFIKARLGTP